jgi:GT2 family glycosyltransferase
LPAGAPKIAVIIVNANTGAHIERALEALDAQTLAPARVIVVDNASTDGSPEAIGERFPSVEVIRLERNVGFAAANNVGVRAADGCDCVALLNPDAFPLTDWLEALARAVERHPEYAFFGSRLVSADAPGVLDGTGDVYHVSGLAWRRDHGRPATVAPPAGEIFSPCAAAALYRRDAFLEVGGFDESYFCYFEDSDLAFRLRLAGYRCLYVPDAVVHHVGSVTAGRFSDFTVYHSFRNLLWTYAKNMPSPLVWLYLPQHVLATGLTLAWFGWRGQGRVLLSSKRDALRELPRVLEQRRAIQRGRKASARELRRAMATGVATPALPIAARVRDRDDAERTRPRGGRGRRQHGASPRA